MRSEVRLLDLWRITRGWRYRLFIASLFSLVTACASIALPLLLNIVFDRVVKSEPTAAHIACIAALILGIGILNAVEAYIVLISAEEIIKAIRKKAVQQLTQLEISEYEKRPLGDLISRVTSDTAALRSGFTSGVVEILGNLLIVVGCCIAMVCLSPTLTIVTILVLIVTVTIMALLSKGMRNISSEMQESIGSVANRILRILEAIRTLRASGAVESERYGVDHSIDTAFELGKRLSRREAVIVPTSSSVLQISLLAVLGAGGILVGNGSLSASALVTFLLYMMMMFMPVASIGPTLTSLFRAAGAYQRLSCIEEIPRETARQTCTKLQATDSIENPDAVISMRGVSFTYDAVADGAERPRNSEISWALNGVSLDVARNKITAIIGPSGAGKSTVFSLLECFYPLRYGQIYIMGQPLTSMTIEEVRSHFAYVEQNAPLLSGTVQDNLCLGLSEVTREECARALEVVGLDHLADDLGRDIDAYVGEHGVLLSGGERQRLALARTLLSDKDILLLDESTSNVDEIAQKKIASFLKGYVMNKTVLMIAHRPALIEAADNVIVLDKGRLVDSGSLEAVRSRCSLYRQLTQVGG